MKRILLSVLGISACTTLSLFAAKSDNVCPKCKAQAQIAAYDDDNDDDNNEEGAVNPALPGSKSPPTGGESRGPTVNPRIQMNVRQLEGMQGNPKAQRNFLRSIKNPQERNRTREQYNAQNPDDKIE
jgi:hypothetical protein